MDPDSTRTIYSAASWMSLLVQTRDPVNKSPVSLPTSAETRSTASETPVLRVVQTYRNYEFFGVRTAEEIRGGGDNP